MSAETAKDLVVVVPGILGSRLVRRGGDERRVVWDLRARVLLRAAREWHRMGRALRDSGGTWEPSPDDGVEADGLLSDPAWLPDFIGIDGYAGMTRRLQEALGERLLTFPYDWRLSNAHTAGLLREGLAPVLEEWRRRPGCSGAKLIFVCHSMGGLVARYYCEHLGGAEDTRRIITIGTPHRGSLKALQVLANGKRLGPYDLGTVARTFPSVWELLPQYPCVRVDDADVHCADAGLATVSGPRLEAAREFHSRIRGPAEARVEAGRPCPYEQTVLFGRIQTTAQFARRRDDGEGVRVYEPGEEGSPYHGGDGTVPSFASFPIELDTTAGGVPLLDKHAAMPSREAALERLVNDLSPLDIRGFKSEDGEPGRPDIDGHTAVLDLPADVPAGRPLRVRVVSPSAEVAVEVHDHTTGQVTYSLATRADERDARGIVTSCDVGPLPEGAYTVVARTPGHAVSDHTTVWDAADPDALEAAHEG